MSGWGNRSKSERVRNATKASHVAAANRRKYSSRRESQQAWRARRPDKSHLRGNRYGNRIYVLTRGASGWFAPAHAVMLTARQLDVFGVLARFDSFEHGLTTSKIADALSIDRASVSNWLVQLRRKFGLCHRNQLLALARELSRNAVRRGAAAQRSELRERGRSSNRASMFEPVSERPASAGEQDSAKRTEALHPGTAPRRAL